MFSCQPHRSGEKNLWKASQKKPRNTKPWMKMEPQHRFSSSFTFSLLRWSLCVLQNRLNSSERSFRKMKETFGSFVRLALLRFLARANIIRMLQSLAAAEATSVEWTIRKQQFMRRKSLRQTPPLFSIFLFLTGRSGLLLPTIVPLALACKKTLFEFHFWPLQATISPKKNSGDTVSL